MKILLTGCRGQLGLAVQKEFLGRAEIISTDFLASVNGTDDVQSLDITDLDAVDEMVLMERPDIIINCAGYTNVDACESNYDTAYAVNATGPRNLAISAEKVGAKLVHISTDYVFAGDNPNPLTEDDTPNPISAYGRMKLAGEKLVSETIDEYYILRTAWLYGEGKNFVKTMLRLSETKDEITVVDDQIGSPTSAIELARTIQTLTKTNHYGIYHTTCEGQTSWAKFAETIFKKYDKNTRVIPISSEEYKKLYPNSADRPAYSVLDNKHLRDVNLPPMADWEVAFDAYVIS